MNQSFSKIWIAVVIILFVAGGIFAWQYFGTQEETREVDTSAWQTYRNKEYGFEMAYPPNWYTEESERGDVISFWSEELKQAADQCLEERKNAPGLQCDIGMYITLGGRLINDSDIILKEYPPLSSLDAVVLRQAVHVADLRVQIPSRLQENASIDFSLYPRWQFREEDRKLFEQILSTFRFVEDETAGWQTYRNDEFGFEVRFPRDWKLEDVPPVFKLQSPQNSSLALYPKGLAIGLSAAPNLKEGMGELAGRKISFISYFTEADEERARFIRFLDIPKGWDGSNWLFVTYKIHNLRTECAVEISPQHPECTIDDGVIFFGDVDDREREVLSKILSTFRFVEK